MGERGGRRVCSCVFVARAGARVFAGCFQGARAALEMYAEWSEEMYTANPNFGEYILSPFGLIGFTEHQARMFLWKHRVPLNPDDKTPKARHCVAFAPASARVGGVRAHFARPRRLAPTACWRRQYERIVIHGRHCAPYGPHLFGAMQRQSLCVCPIRSRARVQVVHVRNIWKLLRKGIAEFSGWPLGDLPTWIVARPRRV